MKRREKHLDRVKNPVRGLGIFLISLGLFMMVAMLDLLKLGDPRDYFKWELLLIFIGLWSLLDGKIVGAILATAAGVWFLQDEMMYEFNHTVEILYWPGVIILVGIVFIISSFNRRLKNIV